MKRNMTEKTQDTTPFMYCIINPDGSPYLDEHYEYWVSEMISDISPVLDNLNRDMDNAGPRYEMIPLFTGTSLPVIPSGLHPDTAKLVIDFASALATKLYKAQLKYGYGANWTRGDWQSECLAHFQQHIGKGDPRDVAAYCAFMWYHGWPTGPLPE